MRAPRAAMVPLREKGSSDARRLLRHSFRICPPESPMTSSHRFINVI
jgi:hypothetical protein